MAHIVDWFSEESALASHHDAFARRSHVVDLVRTHMRIVSIFALFWIRYLSRSAWKYVEETWIVVQGRSTDQEFTIDKFVDLAAVLNIKLEARETVHTSEMLNFLLYHGQ
jgi:hypothetical protein